MVAAGQIDFTVKNRNAAAEVEAELRTADFAHILGEQENLTPGLSGGFSLVMPPGHYVVSCPGAVHPRAPLVVTGSQASGKTNRSLTSATEQYGTYVDQQVAGLVSSTQAMCSAIAAGNQQLAEQLYPPARVFYERIEPVAAVWGTLDTSLDGRIGNPVTNPAALQGFHKLEQLMWSDDTLAGTDPYCAQLVQHEGQLQKLVQAASFSPLTMAAGATDLINEAATSKITGEEERYSNTDLIVFQANVDGAMEVVNLLTPYLQRVDPSLVSEVLGRYRSVEQALATFHASPGYDDTGYVEYTSVNNPGRRHLSAVVQSFAESLSQISGQVT
jgi:iron uptake system component EfeO